MGQAKNSFMEGEERGWHDTGKYVCASCLTAPPLQAAIRANCAPAHTCDFCDSPRAASLDFLMQEHIMPAIREQYVEAAAELSMNDDEAVAVTYDTHDLIETLFYENNASQCDPLINEIKDSIIFTTWCLQDYYCMKPDEVRLFFWHKFSEVVKHANRYFFSSAILGEDFDNPKKNSLSFLSDLRVIIERELVRSMACGTQIFRCRIDIQKHANIAELGAPIYGTSTRANRMSPAGISMFYGALDDETAKREVGPIPAGEVLSLASMILLREIRIVDFCRLPDPPDFFDLGQLGRRFLCRFLRNFVKDLSASIERDGREHIEYVPTQVLTEYLKSSLPIDGMIFPSAKQEGGHCIVLWGKDFVPYSRDTPVAIELAAVEHYS